MNSERITLNKEGYYTHDAQSVIRIVSGSVYVFIVHWEENSTDQKRFPLCEIEAGEFGCSIPAFSWRDQFFQQWRFLIVPKSGTVEIVVFDHATTQKLKRDFIQNHAKLSSFDDEGYENSLVEVCNKNKLKEKVFIYRDGIYVGMNEKDTSGVIKNALEDSNGPGQFDLYRFACKKCHIPLPDKASLTQEERRASLPELAEAENFICRQVSLASDTFSSDSGVLVATYQGEPVVCYPTGFGHYRMYNAQKHTHKKLKKSMIGYIEPIGWSIQRSLPENALQKKDLVHFLLQSFRKRDVLLLTALGILTTLLSLFLPKLNQLIYDEYIPLGDLGVLGQICLVVGALMLGSLFISVAQRLLEYCIPRKASYELQTAAYHRLFQLPESFFRDYESADLGQRVFDAGSVSHQLLMNAITTGVSLIGGCIYFIQMLHYSSALSMAGLLMMAFYAVIIYLLSRLTISRQKRIAALHGESAGKLNQFITGIEKIKMAGAESRSILEYITPVAREEQENIRNNRINALIRVLSEAGPVAFTMVYYYHMVHNNMGLSVGNYIAYATAFGAFSNIVISTVTALLQYVQLKPSVDRSMVVFSTGTENETAKEKMTTLSGAFSMNHVTFGYDKNHPTVNDVSLQVRPGEYVALVGPSGSGKSTIMNLLLGFETPWSGSVSYDGHDLRMTDKRSLRKRIGAVLQNGKLISGSIYENITIMSGSPKAEEVRKVIAEVGLEEEIEDMPMNVHTVLNDGGTTISGGQQQRLLIARAIYNNPAILFLDEATSALDNITQAKVCDSLEKRRMTRFVIAHRLSTVKNCDRILVLNDGRIVETGTYDQLMRLKGLFYQMAVRQIS